MRKEKILYWVSTGLLAAFILPGIFFVNSEMAIEGTRHLGLPEWLRLEVGIATFLGGLVLILPGWPHRVKEWAYVGLGIVYISALIAHFSVDGIVLMSFTPLVTFALLVISYISYHKIVKV